MIQRVREVKEEPAVFGDCRYARYSTWRVVARPLVLGAVTIGLLSRQRLLAPPRPRAAPSARLRPARAMNPNARPFAFNPTAGARAAASDALARLTNVECVQVITAPPADIRAARDVVEVRFFFISASGNHRAIRLTSCFVHRLR